MMLPEETAYFKPAGTQGENRARKIWTNHISYESSLIAQHDHVMHQNKTDVKRQRIYVITNCRELQIGKESA